MIRAKQKTGSHCGPAVFEMMVSSHRLNLDQEKLVDACKARKTVMKLGIPLATLTKGLKNIFPELTVWVKRDSKMSDLEKLLAMEIPVGVNWQGIFDSDEYGDDESDRWGELETKMLKLPALHGQGHYCVALQVDLKKGFIRFADPYGHYAGKDRFVAIWEFEERWWDDRYGRDEKGKKIYVLENRLMFVIVKKDDKRPKKLGMVEL